MSRRRRSVAQRVYLDRVRRSIDITSPVLRDHNFSACQCSSTTAGPDLHWTIWAKSHSMAATSRVESVEDDIPLPPRKRTRIESTVGQQNSAPKLFAPFRALGLISNHVPFVLQTRSQKGATEGPRLHILTCLGKSWALWEGGKMSLLFVGE